jgi:DNA-binding XRE family transcriptional regulator
MKKTAPPKTLAQMVYDKRAATESKLFARRIQSLEEAAEEIGVSTSTLSRVENGSLPTLKAAVKICRWLGVTVESVMATTAPNICPIERNHP